MGSMKSIAVILGSAFHHEALEDLDLQPVVVETEWGAAALHRLAGKGRDAYVIFRHGLPHRLLPNHINFRAQAVALQAAGCRALLTTSSVGVLDPEIPLDRLLPVGDLLTLDNRLPDGTACTMWPKPHEHHGHLVLQEGLFSQALKQQVAALAEDVGASLGPEVVFGYSGGPRTKTRAENRMWARLGAQVNSMTLGPEVVLANELEIPCAALVVGHKYSLADAVATPGKELSASLEASRAATMELVIEFLRRGQPVDYGNRIYRFVDEGEPGGGEE